MGKPHSILYGIPVKEIARILRCSLKTAQRKKTGQVVLHYCELAMLERDLGCFAPEWRGWTINGEDLVAPGGWRVNRGDALAVPMMHGQIAALRDKIVQLGAEDDGLEEQPAPGEVPSILTG